MTSHRYPRRLRDSTFGSWPHPAVSVAVMLGYLAALYPGTLPRDATTTAVLTTVFSALGACTGMVLARRSKRRPDDQARRIVFGSCLVILGCAVGMAVWWQNLIRSAVDVAPAGVGWFAAATLPAAVVVVAIVAVPRTAAVVAAGGLALTAGLLAPADAGADEQRLPVSSSAQQDPETLLRGELRIGEFDAAAADLTRRWTASGGLSARAVVVAVPTGSGWVDSAAADGFDSRFAGDVRILALPYDRVPSWQAFVSDRSGSAESAIAMVSALATVLDGVPAHERPRVILYGQSLGAVGADAARVWLENEHPSLLAETVLVAPPAETVTPISRTPRTVLANSSDPVVRWSLTELWRPHRATDDTHVRGPRVPDAPWLPVISFVQTSVDLLGALDGAAGVGHRYGSEQARPPHPLRN
ncbi:alpha/beta-hydrolase family protein [Gordonia McavH-238-E]|uniref:alpha/beta-hydrolase family protein n=1 Tax=Gordonia sp. McavH-238-E TaxID=2917736 RepID=UPI001EF40F9B|nr:alpha/beta-hydrolase family protein [Gordonia sp. McavH-238-E]MCG7633692.1 alpha/beta-hydrolase family protein [Gordonia sp. McavH-238-E]